jgi:large-conductance mechanosensitive channel
MSNFGTNVLVNAAPFLLVALLWFFLIKRMSKSSATGQQSAARQQEIFEELRALRKSVEDLRKDLNDRR